MNFYFMNIENVKLCPILYTKKEGASESNFLKKQFINDYLKTQQMRVYFVTNFFSLNNPGIIFMLNTYFLRNLVKIV